MRLLFLSFYYDPDLSAGSFRSKALVNELIKSNSNLFIDVVTTLPNRYNSYQRKAIPVERKSSLTITRISVPTHKSGMLDQSITFGVFAVKVRNLIKTKKYDLVYATSSRLMTAVLGAWIANKQKDCLLYLDIRDIFVDTIRDILPKAMRRLVIPVFACSEKWAFKKADKINLVSTGFKEYFNSRYPKKPLSFFTNGIDAEFLKYSPHNIIKKPKDKVLKVLYAGNIGKGQGLHDIIHRIALKSEKMINFRIFGDGGKKNLLISQCLAAGLSNVDIFPPISRTQLIEEYQKADVLFLHLGDFDAFKKVLPSKIFEYAATGKPIWAGVLGYSAEFLKREIENVAIFPPGDVNAALKSLKYLKIIDTPRSTFIKKFSRENISKELASDIIKLLKS
ncbi:MAG: glycosyltransferase WbuB [Pelagibacteraceae bacterium TMED65]|nr:MAG: glycosyltransferase WbuB [Pelagibacteraceae bacterium TMED65]